MKSEAIATRMTSRIKSSDLDNAIDAAESLRRFAIEEGSKAIPKSVDACVLLGMRQAITDTIHLMNMAGISPDARSHLPSIQKSIDLIVDFVDVAAREYTDHDYQPFHVRLTQLILAAKKL